MNNTYNSEWDDMLFILNNKNITECIRNKNINKNMDNISNLYNNYLLLNSCFYNGSIYFYDNNTKKIWEFDKCGTGLIFEVNNEKIYNKLIIYNNL